MKTLADIPIRVGMKLHWLSKRNNPVVVSMLNEVTFICTRGIEYTHNKEINYLWIVEEDKRYINYPEDDDV